MNGRTRHARSAFSCSVVGFLYEAGRRSWHARLRLIAGRAGSLGLVTLAVLLAGTVSQTSCQVRVPGVSVDVDGDSVMVDIPGVSVDVQPGWVQVDVPFVNIDVRECGHRRCDD